MSQLEVYLASPDAIDENRHIATLEEGEAHHLLRVRRARPGDEMMIIDGLGSAWTAKLLTADRHTATLDLGQRYDKWREPPVEVHLGLGVIKPDAFMEAVNLSVQAGVSSIAPLACRYASPGWTENRRERAQRIAVVAAKQCGRGLVPPLPPVQPLLDWGIKQAERTHRLLLEPEGSPFPEINAGETVTLAVGPEGGFSDEEIEALKGMGFTAVALGQRRLRAETAAAVSVARVVLPVENRMARK